MHDVHSFRAQLMSDRKIARAVHNMSCYRFVTTTTPAAAAVTAAGGGSRVVHHDCDDDGEKAAGARLAELLRLMQIEGIGE